MTAHVSGLVVDRRAAILDESTFEPVAEWTRIHVSLRTNHFLSQDAMRLRHVSLSDEIPGNGC